MRAEKRPRSQRSRERALLYYKGTRQRRLCLKCDKPFMSQGIHNRICDNCKETDEWQCVEDMNAVLLPGWRG